MQLEKKLSSFLIILGYPASGKSIATEICKELRIPCIEFSEVLTNFAINTGMIEITDLLTLGIELRNTHGKDAVAKLMKQHLDKNKINKAVLIGARTKEEIDYLKKFFTVKVIAIIVDKQIRHKRWIARNKTTDPKNELQADEYDKKEEQLGIADTVAHADAFIQNNEDLKAFKQKLKNIIIDYFNIKTKKD